MADKYDTKDADQKSVEPKHVDPKPSKPVRISFDIERAAALLGIVEKVAGVAPGYTALSSEAMAELREMNEEIAKKATERSKTEHEEWAKQGITVSPGMPVDPYSSPATAPQVPSAEAQAQAELRAEEAAKLKAKTEEVEKARADANPDAKAKVDAEAKAKADEETKSTGPKVYEPPAPTPPKGEKK